MHVAAAAPTLADRVHGRAASFFSPEVLHHVDYLDCLHVTYFFREL